MPDLLFSDPDLASWYDVFCPWDPRGDFGLYFPLVMAAESVLDVGCGTGMLLRRARETGHAGRLCGLDPADAMLQVARTRSDIEWMLGDLGSVCFEREFDLILMSGHAFQVFVSDDELRVALGAIGSALTDEGRFAFETRNPSAREWERWGDTDTFSDPSGARMRVDRNVESVDGELVTFTHTFTQPGWDQPRVSWSTLRFLDAPALSSFLSDAGLAIAEQFGDWDRTPLTDASPEIITIAHRA